MAHLVDCVNGHPSQRALAATRVAVDDRAFPVRGVEAREDVREEACRISQLASDVITVLLGVSIVFSPFITTHRLQGRPAGPASDQHPLALDQQDVPNMAAVFER